MLLADYYLGDPRLVLVPIEHLGRRGMSAEFAALVQARRGWTPARLELFDAAFTLYWERTRLLAHAGAWAPPRLRNVAVIADPLSVRPYVQLLNTSTWSLYECDLDPAISHPELAAYLLVHGDRMAETGEVTMAAVRAAAYWFDRSDEERAAFAAAAARSPRPDAAAFRALAEATAWLGRLRHETLRPPLVASPHRSIPGTGLLVPRGLEDEPPRLVARWTAAAEAALAAYRGRWRGLEAGALADLCGWLRETAPAVLVTDRRQILWDPARADAVGRLRSTLKQADGVAVRALAADLALVDRHTRRFRAALAEPGALPAPAPDLEPGGYAYIHHERRLIAYDLRESGMERLHGPALPFAHAMLGARTMHEWAHLAALAGWVPRTVEDARFAELVATLAEGLDAVVAAAPARVRLPAAPDLAALAGARTPGRALVETFLARLPDYQANLAAWPFLDVRERETYVRHNVRTLRPFYRPPEIWRMLIRYLYEYQYLELSAVADAPAYFLGSTWFDADFLDSGVLDEQRFTALAAAAHALCACHAVDETRIALPTTPPR